MVQEIPITACPYCYQDLRQTNGVESHTRGMVRFRSWTCDTCGFWRETRKIGQDPEEILLDGEPRSTKDAREQERMEREAEGHREFIAKSRGRRAHS